MSIKICELTVVNDLVCDFSIIYSLIHALFKMQDTNVENIKSMIDNQSLSSSSLEYKAYHIFIFSLFSQLDHVYMLFAWCYVMFFFSFG